MPEGRSITCVIHANKMGGTERVLAALAREWSDRGASVRIIETANTTGDAFYGTGENVGRLTLGLGAPSRGSVAAVVNNIKRIAALRRALRESNPDVVVSFLTEQNVVTILAAAGTGVPVLVSERTDPYTVHKSLPWRMLRWLTYRRAARVVVLTERARSYFQGFARPVVIPNPVAAPKAAPRGARKQVIVGMGRMVQSKNFDVLIASFSAVCASHPSWRLALLGDGPERPRLEAEAGRSAPGGRVRFHGSVPDPETELSRASIFVSCSILEGFPMALCEAMAAGLPVVAATYNESIREIVRDEWNGLLVAPGDREATSRAITRLIEDEDLRARLGDNARESMKRFRPDRIMQMWDGLFEQIGAAQREPDGCRRAGSPGR